MKEQIWQITTMFGSSEEAGAMGKEAVTGNLAACAQVEGPIISIYTWEGKLNEDRETRLTLKTTGEKVTELMEWIKARHPYEVPEILGNTVALVDADYLDWANKP